MTHPNAADSPEISEAAGPGDETNYVLIFLVMCVLTIISITTAVTDMIPSSGQWLVVALVLAIALANTFLVMAYFMHLKFESRWKYMLLCPVIVVATGLPVALYTDIGLHYYGWRNPTAVTAADVAQAEMP